jgi:hypothetical protein
MYKKHGLSVMFCLSFRFHNMDTAKCLMGDALEINGRPGPFLFRYKVSAVCIKSEWPWDLSQGRRSM